MGALVVILGDLDVAKVKDSCQARKDLILKLHTHIHTHTHRV